MATVAIKLLVNSKGANKELSGFQKGLAGLRKVAKVTGAAMVAIGGVALKKGWDRLKAIDEAQAKLKGLGHDAKAVETIMGSALESVKDTAYSFGDAATVAASAVAAGVKPGQELTKHLRLVANSAAISGRSMQDMGAIINKVSTNSVASMEEINQVSDSGIGIMSALAKEYDVTAVEMKKMVSAGKVDAATFNKVLAHTVGDGAQAMGKTVSGSWANMQASLGRIGANLLSGIFPKLAGGFQNITAALGPLEDRAKGAGAAIGTGISLASTAVQQLWSTVSGIDFTPLRDAVGSLFVSLQAAVPKVVSGVQALGRTFGPLLAQVGKFAATALFAGVVVAIEGLSVAVDAVSSGFATAAGFIEDNKTLLGGIAVVIGAALLPSLIATASNLAITTAAWVAYAAVTKSITIATKAYAVAQSALNVVLKANPIGIVITVLAALVAGLIYAYKNSETFRNICQKAFAAIVAAGRSLWSGLKAAFDGVVAAIKWAYGLVKSYVNLYIAGWTGVLNGAKALWNGLKAVWNGVVSATNSAKNKLTGYARNIVAGWGAVVTGVRNMGNGIRSAFNSAVAFVRGIPGTILRSLGNLGSLLWNAGSSIIQGLINGITSRIGSVKSTLTGLTKRLSSWKGPPSTDARLLTPAGRLIIRGLIDGVRQESKNLKRELNAVTAMIGGTEAQMGFGAQRPNLVTAAARHSSGSTSVNVTVQAAPGSNPVDIGRELKKFLDAYFRAGGN